LVANASAKPSMFFFTLTQFLIRIVLVKVGGKTQMTLKYSLALALLGACVPVTFASQFANETFDYPTGSLIGQNGGTGFAGAWTGSSSVGVFTPGMI
jgi:hypothetical protein